MCERDVHWVRSVPDTVALWGPLLPQLQLLWSAMEDRRLPGVAASGRLGDASILDADALTAPTPGILRFAVDCETGDYRQLGALFDCRVCPAEHTATRTESGVAVGDGWACAWQTMQVSPAPPDGWVTVSDHTFVVTTLDRPDASAAVYHLTGPCGIGVPRHETRRCPPIGVDFDALFAEEA